MRVSSNVADIAKIDCSIVFGDRAKPPEPNPDRSSLHVALPLLDGPIEDVILPAAQAPQSVAGFTLFHSASRVAGHWKAEAGRDLETSAYEAYQGLLRLLGGQRLYRAWNFVPHINATEHGLENYRRFCRGRSLAFENHFGADFRRELPAASAVGTSGGSLAIAFVAGSEAPVHYENPAQVPAFNYPAQYGPRPPSFARASAVRFPDGRAQIFISGTAAIRDHRTVGAADLEAQLACTLANLFLIAAAAGAGDDIGIRAGWRRSFRIYLRRSADLATTKARLERELLRPDDIAQYLQADICRADLLVEIEATLTR